MFKKRIFLLVFAAALLIVLPVQAQVDKTIGERINILGGAPTTYPAGEPFHVSHGWSLAAQDNAPAGLWTFELEVDGVSLKPDFIEHTVISYDPTFLGISYIFNFPDGLSSGLHTFTGHWFIPCGQAVRYGVIPGPCSTPNAKIEVFAIPLTVNFTE